MNPAIIACATLESELRLAMEKTGCHFPVFWLKAGDHNSPGRRKEEILRALDNCREFDTILLAMAFCGSAAEGICANQTLILPRCPDCLTLLLGDRRHRTECRDLYLLTRGWMEGQTSILKEYDRCLMTRGEQRTARIFRDMFRHYRGIGLITLPELPEPETAVRAAKFSEVIHLPLIHLAGENQYLEDLLVGNWSEQRFLVIPPGVCVPTLSSFTGGDTHA